MLDSEALMHRVMDGSRVVDPPRTSTAGTANSTPRYDMGSDKFGMVDLAAWDETGAGLEGGGEWS